MLEPQLLLLGRGHGCPRAGFKSLCYSYLLRALNEPFFDKAVKSATLRPMFGENFMLTVEILLKPVPSGIIKYEVLLRCIAVCEVDGPSFVVGRSGPLGYKCIPRNRNPGYL